MALIGFRYNGSLSDLKDIDIPKEMYYEETKQGVQFKIRTNEEINRHDALAIMRCFAEKVSEVTGMTGIKIPT